MSSAEITIIKRDGKRKAFSVWEDNKDAVVLGCDTVVALDNIILGKPENEKDAEISSSSDLRCRLLWQRG